MIVVRIELWSAITGKKTELARMHICNVTSTSKPRIRKGDYYGRTLAKPKFNRIVREGRVEDHPRLSEPVWSLVRKMLEAMGY